MSVLPFTPRLPAFAPLHPLGRGPLGEWVSLVWPLEAGARRGGRPLVVKTFLLAPGLGPDARRPLEEALGRALTLRHPGIARVHGFQVDVRDTLTVVSDYVPGCSLATARRRILGRGERPSEALACHVGAEVVGALGAAHVTGAVHGEVGAHRIRVGPRGEVTLTDFGLRSARPLLRRFASGDGATAEAGADLRALGRVLLALVTGRAVETDAEVDAALGEVSSRLRDVLGRLLEASGTQADCECFQAELRERGAWRGAALVRELAALPGAGPLSPVDAYVGAASVMTASATVRERELRS